MRKAFVALASWATLLVAAGCGSDGVAVPGANGSHGADAIRAFGCGACHAIPGVRGADGQVGPPLGHLASRRSIAGRLPNTPGDLVRWIRDPQRVDPGSLMPDLDVGETDARDIAAYLYSH